MCRFTRFLHPIITEQIQVVLSVNMGAKRQYKMGQYNTVWDMDRVRGCLVQRLGTLSFKKNGKKRGHCPLLATPPPPKRVKRGHLLSDYRQKCVNGTCDSYCGVKSPFLSDLRLILTHIVVSKVHF